MSQRKRRARGEAETSWVNADTVGTGSPDKEVAYEGHMRKRRKSTKIPQERSTNVTEGKETTSPAQTIPWPQHFKQLSQTHSALNLVYTFCCTRKHLATTFETIKTAVEERTRRKLSVQEVVEVKCLAGPRGIRFEWVNGDSGEEGWDEDKESGKRKVVLLFEFLDGADGGRARNKVAVGTEVSQAHLVKAINRRNEKFTNFVNIFLAKCSRDGVEDPELRLKEMCASYMPVFPLSSESAPPTPTPAESSIPPEIPLERKSITQILEEIKTTKDFYHNQIVIDGHFITPAREAVYGDLRFLLSQNLVNALYNARNITRLYSHQAAALNAIYAGEDVIVSTSTSSGKSLIYQLPVVHALENDRRTRAIYIFPTKALAHDQFQGLKELLNWMGEGGTPMEDVEIGTFDGDLELEERRGVRARANIIFTNPDMLHQAILPNETLWKVFLKELRFVVVDGGFYVLPGEVVYAADPLRSW